jgi:hypothetical protein
VPIYSSKNKEASHEKDIYGIGKCRFWQEKCLSVWTSTKTAGVMARTDGEEVFNGRIPASYRSLMKLLERFKDCQIRVAYEDGPCGFSLYDKLIEDGIATIVVPPSLIPTESGNKVKTDKRDSRKLARRLESDMLKKVFVLTEEERMHRELVRTRRQLVDHRGRCSTADKKQAPLLRHILSLPQSIWMGLSLQTVDERHSLAIILFKMRS